MPNGKKKHPAWGMKPTIESETALSVSMFATRRKGGVTSSFPWPWGIFSLTHRNSWPLPWGRSSPPWSDRKGQRSPPEPPKAIGTNDIFDVTYLLVAFGVENLYCPLGRMGLIILLMAKNPGNNHLKCMKPL